MKPKTKLQKKIAALAEGLRPMSQKERTWAGERLFEPEAVIYRKTVYCLECGHTWKSDSYLAEVLLPCVCPSCGKTLKIIQGNGNRSSCEYVSKFEVAGEYQVVRFFFMTKYTKKKTKVYFSVSEVMRHFVGRDGKAKHMMKKTMGFSMYYDNWIRSSEIEFREGRNYSYNRRLGIIPFAYLPGSKFLPEILRNGFRRKFYKYSPAEFFSLLLTDPRFETLVKAGQDKLVKAYDVRKDLIERHWKSVRICMRNGYKPIDATDWLDCLELLDYFGKDLNSPKYVCPEDLAKFHERLERKKRLHDAEVKLKRLKAEIEQAQKDYEERMSRFFVLRFEQDDLVVRPITTVKEFLLEGMELGHCVFSNEYYKKKDTLVLSATRGEERIETVEVNLARMTVVQSRGNNNKPTEYSRIITDLVRSNMDRIAKCI